MRALPEGFEPLVVVGEVDGHVMVYTILSNTDTMDILEQTLEVIAEGEFDEQVLTLQ